MNNALIHADIFFFVTTICIAVLTVLLIIALIYLIKILSTARDVTDKAKVEADFLITEMRHMRERLQDNKPRIVVFYRFIRRVFNRYKNT